MPTPPQPDPPVDAEAAPIDVLFLLLPGSLVLDWAGPAEAFRSANRHLQALGRAARFRLRFVGAQAETHSSVGVQLAGLEPLPAHLNAPSWVVLVGQSSDRFTLDSDEARAALHWLRGLRLAEGQTELVSVCAGAVIAARAGLLAGRQATTHHEHLQDLRAAEPRCEVLANRVFVRDGPVCTSAGVTCGVDLALHRIAAECGAPLAARVAQTLVVALRRGPQDPELSPFLLHRDHLHPAVHRVQDALSQAPQADWPLARMAEVAHASSRHLTRLFAEHAGVSPQDYLRGLRLSVATAALATGYSVSQAAQLSGLGSDTQLRRAWRTAGLAGSPSHAANRAPAST